MENIADLFYEKLEKADRPGNILAKFYEGIFDKPTSVQNIVMFNKLIKVYGKYIPFFAILDLYGFEGEVTTPYGLLSYYCKKRLEQKTAIVVLNDAYKNLDADANKIQKRIEEQRENPAEVEKME
jgi:hypothetical protein